MEFSNPAILSKGMPATFEEAIGQLYDKWIGQPLTPTTVEAIREEAERLVEFYFVPTYTVQAEGNRINVILGLTLPK